MQPAFDLVPGPAASWKAILPSLALVGEPFRLAVVAEDKWGNPTADASQSFEIKVVASRTRAAGPIGGEKRRWSTCDRTILSPIRKAILRFGSRQMAKSSHAPIHYVS